MSEVLSGDEFDGLDRPRLGELLLQAGVISHDVLTKVLAEQARTNLPLGRILVERGYVPAHKIAMALADQEGKAVRTEYGFASGHRPAAATQGPPPLTSVPPLTESPEPPLSAGAPVQPPAPSASEAPTPEPEPEPVVEATARASAAKTLIGPIEVYLPSEIVEVNGHRYAVAKLESAIPTDEEIVAAYRRLVEGQ